jgi:hypothetical protein
MHPVLLSSALKEGVPDDAAPVLSHSCYITHGPCDSYFENIEGKSVGSIRRSLATVFSIPDDAEAFIGGSLVDGQYRLRAGDVVVFLSIACQP